MGASQPKVERKNECACCYSEKCCRGYNRTGIALFLICVILQIVSLATPWMTFNLQRSSNIGDLETLNMKFYTGGVEIFHEMNNATTGNVVSSYEFCSYENRPGVPIKETIIVLANTTICPTLTMVPPLFHNTVTTTGIATIISGVLMILWFFYRSTNNGIKRLFRSKCCTQSVSLLLSAMVIGFAIPGFAIISDQFFAAVKKDFGGYSFWDDWGCEINDYWGSCWDTSNCGYNQNTWFSACNSNVYNDAGFILATTSLGFYVIFCVYSWIGSWCCSCCCPGVEEELFPSATVSVHYSAMGVPTATTFATMSAPYTLYVHHGAQFPSKIMVTASSLPELEAGIRNNLGISVPFKIAVFDEICQQYVLVTSLQLIPQQATIQLLFN